MDRTLRNVARFPPGMVAAIVAVAGLWLWSGSPTASHRVPEVQGLEVNEAVAAAAEEGFEARVELTEAGGVAGMVVGQDPAPQEVRNRGSTITLSVTRGAHQVEVPDVTGMPADEARTEIGRGHLVPGDVVYREDPSRESNRVITTDPPPGSTVDISTPITIIVAS